MAPWTKGGKLCCFSTEKIFETDTRNVAVERHFYKLQRLTNEDIAFLKLVIIDTGPAHAKQLHENFLRGLLAPRAFVESNRHRLANPADMDALLDVQETNVLEDYHMGIEHSFARMLRQLQAGDTSFYSNDKDCIDFAHYMATQYMRTKGIKVRMEETFRQNMNIDITRLWDIASLMQATNIGCSLFLGRKRQPLVLLKNATPVAFVTGDQPIINLHGGNRPKPPTMLSMYYPLSPSMAMIWGEVDEVVPYSSETLTEEQVTHLNKRIVQEAHSQVFAHSADALRQLVAR